MSWSQDVRYAARSLRKRRLRGLLRRGEPDQGHSLQ